MLFYLIIYLSFMVLISISCHFLSAWRTSFKVSVAQVRWRWTLNFCMSEEVFILALYLKAISSGYTILDWQFRSFGSLKMLLSCLLMAWLLMRNPLSSFFYFFIFLSLCNVFFPVAAFFMFLVLGVDWAFYICGFKIFIRFRKLSAIISWNIFWSPSLFPFQWVWCWPTVLFFKLFFSFWLSFLIF